MGSLGDARQSDGGQDVRLDQAARASRAANELLAAPRASQHSNLRHRIATQGMRCPKAQATSAAPHPRVPG